MSIAAAPTEVPISPFLLREVFDYDYAQIGALSTAARRTRGSS